MRNQAKRLLDARKGKHFSLGARFSAVGLTATRKPGAEEALMVLTRRDMLLQMAATTLPLRCLAANADHVDWDFRRAASTPGAVG